MARQTGPQRFTPRTGSHADSRLRRALDGAIDTDRRNDETLEVKGGRLGVRVTDGGGLKQTKQGLEIDKLSVGDKNLDPMQFIRDLDTAATNATVVLKVNELLAEIRRTKRMRS